MINERVYKMAFSSICPLYVQKVEIKGHTKREVDIFISWLTGYDEYGLRTQIGKGVDFETFFAEAPSNQPQYP